MTYIFGDTHGKFKELNSILKHTSDKDVIIICGDFGFWKKTENLWYHDDIQNENHTKIFWCDGNHENHFEIKKLIKDKDVHAPISINDWLYYCPRGSELTLQDGRKVLFFGGASSIDKEQRKYYIDWFPEENITTSDLNNIITKKYDIVVSHTCPTICYSRMCFNIGVNRNTNFDKNCECLQYIFEIIHPKEWYFGHWHTYDRFSINDCNFTSLNMSEKPNSWIKI